MSKASDEHEYRIASNLNLLPDVTAIRPVKGTDYSDVLVNYKGNSAWLEIKMSHRDNLANPRVYYHDKTWKTRYSTPVASIIVKELNKSEESRDFVYSISEYSGLSLEAICIPTNRGEMDGPNCVRRDTMRVFCKQNGAYILDQKDRPLGDLVTLHYTQGKTEPAYYMQAGDDFYRISNTNPLCLSEDIPLIDGTGKFRVRVSNRSKFYEIQAEIKMTAMPNSAFSVLPGSNKQNPFM